MEMLDVVSYILPDICYSFYCRFNCIFSPYCKLVNRQTGKPGFVLLLFYCILKSKIHFNTGM